MLNCAVGRLNAAPIRTLGENGRMNAYGKYSAVSMHAETTVPTMDLVVSNLSIPVYQIQIYEHYALSDSYFRLIERVKRTTTLKHLIVSVCALASA